MSQNLSQVNIVLNANSAEYVRKLAQTQKKTNTELKKMEKSYNKLSSAISPVTSTALAAGAALLSVAENARQNAVELERSAYAAGLTVPEFQAMSLAVKTVGINTEQLGSILGDTEEKVADFLTSGGGGFLDFVEVMGFTKEEAREVAKELQGLSGRDVLVEMTRRMEEAGVSGEKMNLALEGMASDSRHLIPLLRDNGRELETMEKRMGSLATTLEEETVDELNKLATVTTIVANNMSNTLATALVSVSDYLLEAGENAAFFWASLQTGTSQQVLSDMATVSDQMNAIKREIGELEDGNTFANFIGQGDEQIEKRLDRLAELEVEYKKLSDQYKSLQGLEVPELPSGTIEVDTVINPPEPKTQFDKDLEKKAGDISMSSGSLLGAISQEEIEASNKLMEEEMKKLQQYSSDLKDLSNENALNRALMGGNPDEILSAKNDLLNSSMQQEIDSLDKSLMTTEQYEANKSAIEEKYRIQRSELAQRDSDERMAIMEEEILKMEQYSSDLQALTQQNDLSRAIIGGNPEEIIAAKDALLETSMQQEIDSLDQRLMTTEQFEANKAAIEDKYRLAKQQADKDAAQKKHDLDKAYQDMELTVAKTTVDSLGQINSIMGEDNQVLNAALFAAQQVLAIAQVTIDTQRASMAALAIDPTGLLSAKAEMQGSIALGIIGATSVAKAASGQFHGGIDELPQSMDNKSFMLKAGERVVQPKANEELTEFLGAQKENGYQSGGQQVINAPLTINGSVTDEAWFNKKLVQHRNTIAASVKKVEKERPNKSRR